MGWCAVMSRTSVWRAAGGNGGREGVGSDRGRRGGRGRQEVHQRAGQQRTPTPGHSLPRPAAPRVSLVLLLLCRIAVGACSCRWLYRDHAKRSLELSRRDNPAGAPINPEV